MTGRQVELHPEALTEAQEAFYWYKERNPATAAAFRTEIDLAIEAITESPERFPRFLRGTRRFLLHVSVFGCLPHHGRCDSSGRVCARAAQAGILEGSLTASPSMPVCERINGLHRPANYIPFSIQ
jgi:plasmid stabilization system protein ParE